MSVFLPGAFRCCVFFPVNKDCSCFGTDSVASSSCKCGHTHSSFLKTLTFRGAILDYAREIFRHVSSDVHAVADCCVSARC